MKTALQEPEIVTRKGKPVSVMNGANLRRVWDGFSDGFGLGAAWTAGGSQAKAAKNCRNPKALRARGESGLACGRSPLWDCGDYSPLSGTEEAVSAPQTSLKLAPFGSVILPIKAYEELLERVEDAEDLAMLKRARKAPLHYRPLEDYLKERVRQ